LPIEPLIGYNLSVIIGALALRVSLWLGQRLPVPNQPASFLLVPVAFFTCLVGFVLLTTRRKAITQVLGFLTLENGVYAFGAAVALDMPILVELGILLDVFVAVFVMRSCNSRFLAAAAASPGSAAVSLVLKDLLSRAPHLNPLWLKAAFVLMLVGYGTKMGLAPFHTWLPDAHSEAPSVASALLSGALLNCAFLGILRIH
jgi:hypothetical protein